MLVIAKKSPRKWQLDEWRFREIRLRDKPMFEEYVKKCQYPANLWSSNFAYLWADSQSSSKKVLWRIVDGMLVTFVFLRKQGLHLICLPFGEGNAEKVLQVVYKCLKYCNSWNRRRGAYPATVRTINAAQLKFLRQSSKFSSYFKWKQLNGIERHFDIRQLVTLHGKSFSDIRYRINRFKRNHHHALIRPYKSEDYQQLRKVNAAWKQSAKKRYSLIFDDVYFHAILKNQAELDHLILVVENQNKIVGMVTGGILPTGESWGCLLKKLAHVDGLNEFMIVEFAREINRINPQVHLLNVGSDLGVAGLITFKEKFRPVLNLARYRLRLAT